jgi:hypothetical protein
MTVADAAWGGSDDPREVHCLALLREHLEAEGALAEVAVNARSSKSAQAVASEDLPQRWQHLLEEAVETASRAAAGRRVAVEVPSALLQEDEFEDRLGRLKLLLEARIADLPELAGVKVWRWTSRTSERAYTESGERAGLELRLSPPPTAGTSA